MKQIVAIVGRPNVGKSTLFNRLVGQRKAIVDAKSGVTRDRLYGECEWNDVLFTIIDTGGYVIKSQNVFEEEIKKQVLIATEDADLILFVVDVKSGITDYDLHIANLLRKTDKKKIVVVNKVDNFSTLYDVNVFYKLGIGKELFSISAINGFGSGDLLDEITAHFNTQQQEEILDIPKLSFVGRPNVGKSSTINVLLGENRNIVTDIAGTTRDTIQTKYAKFGYTFFLIDTAGLRKKRKVDEDLEFYSVIRALRAIENSDVCILIIDAVRSVEAQDLYILQLIKKNKKGVVIMVNKWDLIKKEKDTHKVYLQEIKKKLAPFSDVPIIFASALTKNRVLKVLEEALCVYKNKNKKIQTSTLNDIMQEVMKKNPPPTTKGKLINIKYVVQLPSQSPSFAFYCNLPQYVKESYKRFLKNQIRKYWVFTGVPIQIYMRKK